MLFRLAIFWQCLFVLANVASADDDSSQTLIDFDKNRGMLIVAGDDALRQMDDFSFSIDVKFSTFRAGNFFFLNQGWAVDGFYFQFDGNQLVLGFGDKASLSQAVSPMGLFETGVWYRLSGVKNGARASLFVDGREVAIASVADDIVDSPADFMIGSGDYTPSVAIGEFTLWSRPLTAEQVAAHASRTDGGSLPAPVIRYLPGQPLNGEIQNSVSTRYQAVFVRQETGSVDAGDVELAAASLDGVSNGMRGAAFVALTLAPLAVYGCGLAVTGRRRWSFGVFPLSLQLLFAAALLTILAIVVLRSELGISLVKMTELRLSDSFADVLEGGFLVFSHLLMLVSIALCFKLLTGDQKRFFDLFTNTEARPFRYFSMLLIALGPLAAYWLCANLIGLSSGSATTSGLLTASVVYSAALTLAAVIAVCMEQGNEAERRQLPDADVTRIGTKLERALENEDLYRNPDLTLRQLSDAVGTTEHRVSEILNHHLDTNFYDFVNGRRITEAKLILQRDRERAVLDIALEVGFNSKSTFYTAFKKVTGQSPAAFRRSVSEDAQNAVKSGNDMAGDRSIA